MPVNGTLRPDGAVTVTISKQAEGDRVWMTAAVRKGDKETLKIRQRWKPGDKWWTDYERYRDGRKELTAQAGPPVAATPLPPPTPPPPGAPAVSDLKDDERLHVAITLNMERRPVQDLLDVVSQKTGAPLTIDAPLAAAVPMFSSYSFVNMPANLVMDQIAFHSIVDGRWEKAGDGYCLHGTRSVDPRPVVGPPAPAPDLRWRLILVVASLALVGGSGAVWAVFHFRRKRVPPAV